MADDKLEREEGEYFSLEDGSGVLLLESGGVVVVHEGPDFGIGRNIRMSLRRG